MHRHSIYKSRLHTYVIFRTRENESARTQETRGMDRDDSKKRFMGVLMHLLINERSFDHLAQVPRSQRRTKSWVNKLWGKRNKQKKES